MGYTRTQETDAAGKVAISDAKLYQDAYKLRLTKEPVGEVTIVVRPEPIASDAKAQLLAKGLEQDSEVFERITKRDQIEFSHNILYVSTEISVSFDSTNWFQWKEVRVTAVDDDVTEGSDLLNFPSQSSFLSLM